MFIIELIYKANLARIDAHMRDHMRFINAHYASGRFVVSGRKVPRDGGIIMAVGTDRAAIEAIAQGRIRSSRSGSPTCASSSSAPVSARRTFRRGSTANRDDR